VNSPSVIHETVDAETIIVNLDTGSYYDLNHVGAYILELIERGATPDQLGTGVMSRYGLDPDAARSATEGLVDELLAEEIIVAVDGHENGGGVGEDQLIASPDSRPFAMPALGKHTDMQDLLLLDPVHEFETEPPPEVRW
jgi:hypothetical protein